MANSLEPLIEDAFKDLPRIYENNLPNPAQPLIALFFDYELANPWGLGSLFKIEGVSTDDPIESSFIEQKTTTTQSGVEKNEVQFSQSETHYNDTQIFFKETKDDLVSEEFIAKDDFNFVEKMLKMYADVHKTFVDTVTGTDI